MITTDTIKNYSFENAEKTVMDNYPNHEIIYDFERLEAVYNYIYYFDAGDYEYDNYSDSIYDFVFDIINYYYPSFKEILDYISENDQDNYYDYIYDPLTSIDLFTDGDPYGKCFNNEGQDNERIIRAVDLVICTAKESLTEYCEEVVKDGL